MKPLITRLSRANSEGRFSEANSRFRSLTKIAFVLAGVLILRAVWVQLIGDSRIAELSKKQSYGKLVVQPKRGEIKDRNGVALAVNSEAYSLAVDALRLENPAQFAFLIQKSLGISSTKLRQKLKERIKEKKSFYWVKRDLSAAELNQLKRFRIIALRPNGYSGALVSGALLVRENKRIYPQGELAGQVIGSINIDGEGIEGLELHENERLRGQSLSVSAVKDALGRPSALNLSEVKKADSIQANADGRDLTTTLDAAIQFATENILKGAVARFQARSGVAIVMDATNGEIITLAQVPLRNANEKNASQASRRNRAITDGYEPGSTLKSVILAGALQQGMKGSDTIWGERGDFKVQGFRIPEAEAHEKFEWMSLNEVLQFSSNIGAAKIALRLGNKKVAALLEKFGFGKKTQLELPGEIAGRLGLNSGKNQEIIWKPLRLANIGFGQGILVSPIQIARAYATFFNGGYLVQPHLLKGEHNQEQVDQPPRILSDSHATQIRNALVLAVGEKGTGKKAQVPGYQIAGKTGTSQLVDERTGKYSKSNYVSSFVGSIVGVQPRLVVYVSIYEPRGAFYGGEVAAPVFKEIAEYLIQRYHFPPDFQIPVEAPSLVAAPVDIPQKPEAPIKDREPTVAHGFPNLIGLKPKQALRVLKQLDANIEIRGFEGPATKIKRRSTERVIVAQSPAPGTEISHHSKKEPIVIRVKLNDQ